MACLFRKNAIHRPILRHALGFLLIMGVLAPSLPVFAADDRLDRVSAHDQVFRFIEGLRGKTAAKRYTTLIVRSARKHRLHPLLVANLIQVESSFNPRAISPVGAIGLMQVMPFHYTKKRIPISSWHDPAINIDLGCQIFATYVAMMSKRYPGLSPTSLQHRALVAYNMGPRAVVSRGIYRSRYSQKVFRDGGLLAMARKPAPPVSPPPVAIGEAPAPLTWEQLPLANPALNLGLREENASPLRIGFPLPESVFLMPAGTPNDLPLFEAETGTP